MSAIAALGELGELALAESEAIFESSGLGVVSTAVNLAETAEGVAVEWYDGHLRCHEPECGVAGDGNAGTFGEPRLRGER